MDDKLSTEDAITVLRNLQDWLYFSSMNGGTSIQRKAIDMAVRALKSQPSELRWVPCSEKLYPDTDGIYLITVRIGDSVFIEVSHFINMDGSVFWVDHDYNFGEVIAWMPAIEPYKGG